MSIFNSSSIVFSLNFALFTSLYSSSDSSDSDSSDPCSSNSDSSSSDFDASDSDSARSVTKYFFFNL